ncbi:translesion DNA synthesis-associated protein ImuA [Alteromonas aestuariivivens]|uniref:Translesion DNA synthesis-associated protein ImuA n=1 Tax=Alteromonas aestuariivivens TaxID=1938339 RepID=A0A3D8M2M3_9ALTE|nr:translesion DNA synthesis-associated protein ImuA [Alteromonas aestuariivivens]RDV23939.1 translesion DNA synthesis-associated protein ImuA [Alteromonas aestuariivivens]
MNDAEFSLLQLPGIWRAKEGLNVSGCTRQETGHRELDKALNGGFPPSGLVRIRSHLGIGELSLLQSIICQPKSQKLLVFVAAPGLVQAPWLKQLGVDLPQVYVIQPPNDNEALWATEQCLKSGACRMVVLWQTALQPKPARRLQVAATHNHTLCLLMESLQSSRLSLPVTLDLALHPSEQSLYADILKQQGGWPRENIPVRLQHTPDNSAIMKAMAAASPIYSGSSQAG